MMYVIHSASGNGLKRVLESQSDSKYVLNVRTKILQACAQLLESTGSRLAALRVEECGSCPTMGRSYQEGSFEEPPGPSGAFEPGREAESRQKLFNRIAPVYDELNNRLSFGQHWSWKTSAVKWSGARPGQQVLDVCCGSGDIAFLLAKLVGIRGQVVGLDFAADMLRDAANRQSQSRLPGLNAFTTPMNWVQGDATALPFPDCEFDAATMGYGLRNIADRPKALEELHRVLRPGASVAVLDFNNSTDPTVDSVQAWFLENLVVPAARQYNVADEYEYLRPSIKSFPTGFEQEQMALQAGFEEAKHYELGFGLMGCLVATKGYSMRT